MNEELIDTIQEWLDCYGEPYHQTGYRGRYAGCCTVARGKGFQMCFDNGFDQQSPDLKIDYSHESLHLESVNGGCVFDKQSIDGQTATDEQINQFLKRFCGGWGAKTFDGRGMFGTFGRLKIFFQKNFPLPIENRDYGAKPPKREKVFYNAVNAGYHPPPIKSNQQTENERETR